MCGLESIENFSDSKFPGFPRTSSNTLDEILSLGVLGPALRSGLRAPVPDRVWATDAEGSAVVLFVVRILVQVRERSFFGIEMCVVAIRLWITVIWSC